MSSVAVTSKNNNNNNNTTTNNNNHNGNGASTNKAAEIKAIGSIIRALVTSRKPPCHLRDVLREYREVESHPVPFQKLGYKSAEELLRETNLFRFSQFGTELCIEARPNPKTSHITSLVRGQKASKTTRVTPLQEVRKPKQLYGRAGFGSGGDRNNNNTNNYYKPQQQQLIHDKQQQQQQQSKQQQSQSTQQQQTAKQPPKDLREILNAKYQHQFKAQPNKEQSAANKSTQQKMSSEAAKMPRPILGQKNGGMMPPQGQQQQQQPQQTKQQQHQPHQTKQQQQQAPQQQQRVQQGPPPTSQQQHPRVQPPTSQQHPRAQPPAPTPSQHQQHPRVQPPTPPHNQQQQQHHHHLQQQQQQQQQQQSQVGRSTVQNRLRINGGVNGGAPNGGSAVDGIANAVNGLSISIVNGGGGGNAGLQNAQQRSVKTTRPLDETPLPATMLSAKYTSKQQQRAPFEFNPQMDPIVSLMQFAASRGQPQPQYSTFKSKYSGLFQCRVNMAGTIYSTYPNEYETEISAKILCAEKAIEQIRLQLARRPLPPCPDTDEQLVVKVHREMLSHACGIFAKNLPEWFEETFEQTLPTHWWQLIEMANNRFTIEEGANNAVIVCAVKSPTTTPVGGNGVVAVGKPNIIAPPTPPPPTVIQLPGIDLPWQERQWNLHIIHCASTMDIWARLIGPAYNCRYNQLIDEITAHMLKAKARPVSIACGHIYLVYETECWHRVRVEEMNRSEGVALCCYIDFGDVHWLAADQLYICEMRFLKLPAQAVAFSLFGLEDFGDNPNANSQLEALQGQTLVGEVITKEAEFAGRVCVVLYDTSGEEDRELNPHLLEQICHNTPAPQLDAKNLENVVVTHITEAGEVYLRLLDEAGWKYVQKLTQKQLESKFKREQHQVTRNDMLQQQQQQTRNKLFLICDDNEDDMVEQSMGGGGSGASSLSSAGSGNSSSNPLMWHRAQLAPPRHTSFLNTVSPQPGEGMYDMFLVDVGSTRRIHISCIFRVEQLSTALSKFPPQAIRVRLHDIPEITPNIVGRMRALLPLKRDAMTRKKSPDTVHIYSRIGDTVFLVNEAIRVEHELSSADPLHIKIDGGATTPSSGIGGGGALSPPYSNGRNSFGSVSSTSSGLSTPTTPPVGGGVGGKPFIDLTRGLTITKVPDSPQKCGDLAALREYTAIPKLGDFFEVRVTMSANPSNFTIQPYKDYPALRLLMKELQEFCEANDEFIPADMVEKGQAYAAKNPDGFYHRVTVVDKYTSDMIHVCYCDFGDIAILSNEQLKTLPARFRHLPKMALPAKLYGITPRNGDWTLEDCLRFRALTVGQKFVSTIRKISLDTLAVPAAKLYELELIDVTTEEDVFIHQLLLKEQRAVGN